MHLKSTVARLVVLITAGIALVACVGMSTQYQTFDAPRGEDGDNLTASMARVVSYELSEMFFRSPPSCVLVLPVHDALDPEAAMLIEQSVTRFLRDRFARVIGPHKRRADERRLALLTGTEDGRQVYLIDQCCDSYLTIRLEQSEAVYALFWSGRQIGLSMSLMRAEDAHLMWRAAHTARRSDGGVPLSLLSLPIATYESTKFHLDTDIVPSMVDDVVRRIFSTLPAI